MEFDKSKIYTAVNADELKAGDVVIVSDNLANLRYRVESADVTRELTYVRAENYRNRFEVADSTYNLVYLIAKHDDPYKELKKAQAEGKEIWFKDPYGNGEWCKGTRCAFTYPIDRYSLTEPTEQYKVFLYSGHFVFTYAEVPDGAHVYYTANTPHLVNVWCTEHQKFADVAKAWEDGKQIQVKQTNGSWEYIEQPQWNTEHEYRVTPVTLKWTDLKVGDVIRRKDGNSTALVTQIDIEDKTGYERHVSIGFEWFDDTKLADWEKVEE